MLSGSTTAADALMDRNIWRNSYASFPKLPCPHCPKGTLKTFKGSMQTKETEYSKQEHRERGWVPELATERFVCLLVCEVPYCGEVVSVAGDVDRSTIDSFDSETGEAVEFQDTEYLPRFMRPAPPLFSISKKLSNECAGHLKKAFELLWVDPASCANRIRIFVEYLLDQFTIPRLSTNDKGKEYEMKLFQRIDLLEKTRPGHKKTLSALRNVGNFASHSGHAKFETLIDCFELLEVIVADLVDGRQDRLDKITERLSLRSAEF